VPVPSNPTLEELVTEGLAKAGESSPDADLLARAEDTWIEEIKNDIWELGKKSKTLHITSYGVFQEGQSRYSNPTDFSSDLSLTILDGTVRGIAQAGSVSSITLAANDASGSDSIIGKGIIILTNTGQGSYSQVTAYDSSTKIAQVVPNFNTAPGVGSGYMIVDQEYPVEQRPIFEYDRNRNIPILGIADRFYPMGDEDFGEFLLNKAPDKVYGARLRYYANLMKIDTDSTLMSTIYHRWRVIFVEGIRFKKIDDEDDDRSQPAEDRYRRKMQAIIGRETYGMDISNLVDQVTDYQ
jgi:hypothetical protein